MGTIISLFMSGYLCEYVGWESLFYVYGEWHSEESRFLKLRNLCHYLR